MAPDIAKEEGFWGVLGIRILGGALSLCGALSYAELATAYPVEGGVYLFISSGYNHGAALFQILNVKPERVWENKQSSHDRIHCRNAAGDLVCVDVNGK